MKHKIILAIFIILVSLIYGLPHLILSSKVGIQYKPLVISKISPIARDELYAYAPLVNYIKNGHLLVKDAYVAEYSNFPTPFMGESIPSIIFGALSQITGSIDKAFIAADFIFPPIIFLLLLIIAKLFVRNNFFALSTVFLTSIARDFIAVIPFPHATYQYLTVAENQNYFLYLSRSFHPQLTYIFFLCALIFLIKSANNPKSK